MNKLRIPHMTTKLKIALVMLAVGVLLMVCASFMSGSGVSGSGSAGDTSGNGTGSAGNDGKNTSSSASTQGDTSFTNGVDGSVIYDGAVNGSVSDWRVITEYHRAQIEAFVDEIKGAGKATVIVRIDSSSVIELVRKSTLKEENKTENDGEGGTRTEGTRDESDDWLIVKDSSGNERVVAVSETLPSVKSICVTCAGGGSSVVQERIITALMALYDLPASKIIVVAGE